MINAKKFEDFLRLAKQKLEGEWIVIGSAVLIAFKSRTRFTEDIDFVNLNFKNDSMPIWEIAQELGLNIEQINQAGGFFLSKIPNFRQDCIVYLKSKNLTIYLPNAYLYFQLKLARFSDTDTQDCIEYLKLAPNVDTIDSNRMWIIIDESRGSKRNKDRLRAELRLAKDSRHE